VAGGFDVLQLSRRLRGEKHKARRDDFIVARFFNFPLTVQPNPGEFPLSGRLMR
jgi:hypothetical protein